MSGDEAALHDTDTADMVGGRRAVERGPEIAGRAGGRT
jgi:hypothetical protein